MAIFFEGATRIMLDGAGIVIVNNKFFTFLPRRLKLILLFCSTFIRFGLLNPGKDGSGISCNEIDTKGSKNQ